MKNGTNGFLLITFNGVGVQVWCLQSLCGKFNGGSDRRFRFWIRFIFHGQNTWKTERKSHMTLVFGDFLMKGTTFSKKCSTLKPSPISGLQKLRKNFIGRTWRFGDYWFQRNKWKWERTVFCLLLGMEWTYRYGVFTAFVPNLMADQIGFSDFGSVPFFMAKTRGKRNVNLVWL